MPRQVEAGKKAKTSNAARIEGPPLNIESIAVVSAWLSVKTRKGGTTPCHALYDSYWRYCKAQSLLSLSYVNFMRAMRMKYRSTPQIPGIAYIGVELQ